MIVLEQTDDLGDVGVDGAALLAQRLFAAEAAVGFVQNVKCHGSSLRLLCRRCVVSKFLYYNTPKPPRHTSAEIDKFCRKFSVITSKRYFFEK